MSEAQPKIIHSNNKEKMRAVNMALTSFIKRLNEKAEEMVRAGQFDGNPLRIVSRDDTDLLFLRKQLVEFLKSGMIGRKDQELEIALLAALVWANRKSLEGERVFDIF